MKLADKIRIHDADRHVIEPLDLWQRYLDPQIYAECPISLRFDNEQAAQARVARLGPAAGVTLPPQYYIGDQPILAHWGEDIQIASANKQSTSGAQRKAAMAGDSQYQSMVASGISRASLFSTFAGYVVNHQQVSSKVSLAYADAYNRWLKDYCAHDRQNLRPVALISRHEPSNMVAQLDKVLSWGWSCVTLRPEIIAGRSLAHPDYESFWQACSQQGVAIALHGGTHLQAATVGTDRFTSRFALHACSHPLEMQMAFVSLLEAGVFERHPQLKFAFLEAGAGWVPYWLWRLDNICYPEFSELSQTNIRILPSEYFKRQCWVAIEIEEPGLRQTIAAVGISRLLFGTDFPHPDHLHFDLSTLNADHADQRDGVGSTQKNGINDLTTAELQALLQDNPQAFFEFNPSH